MVNPAFSLESLALSKIAILVYSDPDIKISQCRKRGSLEFLPQDDWKPIIQKKFSSLNLPLILGKKLKALMKPFDDEINVWKVEHFPILNDFVLEQSIEYVWNYYGTIDRIKTAESYIQCESLCNWPLHRQFQIMTERIFSLLTEKEFRQLVLLVICDKIAWDWMDWDYVELLNELWNRSPVHFKQYVESSEFFDILKMALNHDYKKPFRDRCPLENIKKIEKSFYNISYG
ncbi:hypothetical protein NPIL_112011 [Nephila pilipes]|uniref:Uncharacterized protein n=1 Tax=Nephila pilipes TaxID=299642 RepID=A0A8X6QFW3_NEPPI|nr:hypothetical protein NPIL_112011 [Nephila pilipes]